MLAALLIVFREVLEAGLVIGIVLAATKTVARRGRWVASGIVGGVAGAAVVAVFAGTIANAMAGNGQELFNGAILAAAALMLGWHHLWMARHGRALAAEMSAMGRAVTDGSRSLAALAIVVGVAVLREGAEVVLFLYGIVVAGDDSPAALFSGGLLGIAAGAAAAALLYFGLLAIPQRRLFAVTGVLLCLLTAGMASQAAGFFVAADLVPSWGDEVWDSSAILAQSSLIGRALHALIGYSDRPAGIQVAVYLATLATLAGLGRAARPTRLAFRPVPASR